mgnify:CR=1 FL=1
MRNIYRHIGLIFLSGLFFTVGAYAQPTYNSARTISATQVEISFNSSLTAIGAAGLFTIPGVNVTGAIVDPGDDTKALLTCDPFGTDFSLSAGPGGMSLAAGAVTDAGGASVLQDELAVADGAAPVLLSAQTTSLTNIRLTFSEDVTVSTPAGTEFTSGDFTVSAATSAGGALVDLTVAGIADGAFSSTDLDIAVDAVADVSAGTIGNAAALDQTVDDGIAPTFVSAQTTSLTNIRLTFSEQITVTTAGGGDFSSSGGDFTVTGAVVFGTNQVDLTVNTLSGTDFTSTDLDIAVDAVKDVGGLTNGIAAIADRTVADGAAPVLLSAQTTSLTNIRLTFSEDVTVSTPAGTEFTSGDFTVSAATSAGGALVDLTVAGIADGAFSSTDLDIAVDAVADVSAGTIGNAAALDQTVDDGIAPTFVSAQTTSLTNIRLTFSEQITVTTAGGGDFSSSGGDFTVTGAVVFGTNQVDLTVNTLSGTDFTSTDLDIAADAVKDAGALTNGIAAIADRTVADGAAPALLSAQTTSLTNIRLTFSEPITVTTAGGGDFTSSGGDFTVSAAAVFGSSQVDLTVGALADGSFSSSDLDIAAGAVADVSAGTIGNAAALDQTVDDGIAPTFVSAQTTSLTNIRLTFSEAVTVVTASGTDFGIGGLTITGAASFSATEVDLTVDPLSGTDFTSTDLDISAGAVEDGGSNPVASTLDQTIADGAAPVLLSAQTTSLTNIRLTFSEDVTVSTPAGTEFTSGDFTVSAATSAGGALVDLTVAGIANGAFSSTDLDIAVDAVADVSAGTIGNAAALDQTVDDGIAPTFVSAQTTSLTNIRLTFSEQITVTTAGGGDFSSSGGDFTVTGAVVFGTNQVDLTVNTLSGTDFTSTDLDIAVDAVKDAGALTNGIAAIADRTIADGVAPTVVSAVTKDNTPDGYIDQIVITFSEDIAAGSIDVDGGSDDFSVAGYTISSAAVSAANEVTLTLNTGGSPDTGVTPDVNIVASQVTDLNAVAAIAATVGTSDGAAPYIVSSSVQSANAYFEVVFSEVVVKQGGGTLTKADFTTATSPNGGATISIGSTLQDDQDQDLVPAGSAVIRFILTAAPTVLDVTGAETVSVAVNGANVKDGSDNTLVGTTGNKNLNLIDVSNLLRIISAVPQPDNSYVTITFSEDVYRDGTSDRTIHIANSNNGQIKRDDYTNGTSLCDEDELCLIYNANGTGVVINDNDDADIQWARNQSPKSLLSNNDNYFGPSFRLYLNDIVGTPTGKETYTLKVRNNSQISAKADPSKFMLDIAANQFTFYLADEAAPVFSPNPVATGSNVVGSAGIFSSDELITISADLGESGLTVTADLTNLLLSLSATQPMTEVGATGVYTYQLPIPAKFLNNGVRNIPIKATDASVNLNSTTNSTLNVTVDSQGPALTVNSLITTDQTPLLEGLATGAASVSITIDGPGGPYGPYVSGGAVTLSGGSWSLNVPTTLPFGTYSVNVTGLDAESNSSADITNNELLISNGVNISALNLTQICVDGGYRTGSFAITETQNGDIQQGTSKVFSVQLPNGFVFNTAVIPTFSDTQGGGNPVTGSVSFPANNVLRVTYTASAGSLGQLNDITIANVQVATNLATATATADVLNLGGAASILGLDVGTDLGDVGSIKPGAPVASKATHEYYTQVLSGSISYGGASAAPISITGNTNNLVWYENEALTLSNAALNGSINPPMKGLAGWGFVDADNNNVPDSPGGLSTYWVTQTENGCRSIATKVSVAAIRFVFSTNTDKFVIDDSNGANLAADLDVVKYDGVFSGPGLGGQSPSGNSITTKFIPSTAGIGNHNINFEITNKTTQVAYTKVKTLQVVESTSIFAENADVDPGNNIPTEYCQDDFVSPAFTAEIPVGKQFYGFALYSPYGGGYLNYDPLRILPGFDFSPNLTNASGDLNNPNGWRFYISDHLSSLPSTKDPYVYIFRYTWDGITPPCYSCWDAYQIIYLRTLPTVTIKNLNSAYCADASSSYAITASISNGGANGPNITSWPNYKITNVTRGTGPKTFSGEIIDMAALASDGTVGLNGLAQSEYKLEVITSDAQDPAFMCASTGSQNFNLYREPVAPVLTPAVYEFNYCSNETLVAGDFVFESPDFPDDPVTYTFYKDNGGIPGNKVETNDDGKFINLAGVGLDDFSSLNSSNRRDNFVFHVTQTFKGAIQSCEGAFQTVTVNVFYEPSPPQVQGATLIGDTYVIEYCQGEAVSPIQLNAGSLDSGDENSSYFSWYENADLSGPLFPATGGTQYIQATAADLSIDTNTPGIYDFYVTQSDYLSEFAGCTSVARKVEVRIVQSPTAPSLTETAFYTCQNNAVGNISAPAETGVAYQWYIDDGDQVAELGGDDVKFASATNVITNADLVGAGFNPANNGFTYVWVTKLQDQNAATLFAGCEGPPTKLTITVYPEAGVPTIVDNVNAGHGPVLPADNIGGVPVYEFKYCIEDVTTSVEFQVSNTFTAFTGAGETRKYNWYQAALNGGGTAIVKAVSSPLILSGADVERKTANASDLFLIGSPPSERYFLISQTTNIRGDGKHLGCESNLVALKVTLYGTPGTPTDASGTNDYYYCNGATIDNITMNGAVGATFNWYNVDPLDNPGAIPIFQGPSASAADLSINNEPANQVLEQTSVFYVTQVVNIDNGITPPFVGCESNRRRISVTVVPIPPRPVMASVPDDTNPRYAMCEGDAVVPSFSIANRFPGATVQFWDVDKNIPLAATNSSFTPSVADYPPSGTLYNFKVTQTIRDDVFAGCESSVEFFTFYHAPIAGVPHTTGTNDVYTYCIGEEIGNLQIDANINSIFTYRWFSDVNLNNLLTTTTSVNNDVVPSLNPTFDSKKAGTYTYYVTSEVTGQGCQSAATKVEVVINSLPAVTMTFDDDDKTPVPSTYAICVDNGTFNLVGSLAGTLAGTFKGTGITDNGDGTAIFDPLLAVGLTNPQELPAAENPEFTITYTLTNANGCIDSLQRVVRVKPLTVVDFSSTISFDEENSNLLVDVSESQVIRFTGNQSNGTFTGTGTTTTSLTTAVFAPFAARDEDLYGANTSYPITYGSSGTNGCYNEVTKTVTVQPIPQVDLVVTGGCSSFDIDLTANVANAEALGGVSSVEWTIKGDASNAQETVIGTGINFTYTEKPTPGNYIFKAKVTGVNGTVNSVEVVRNIGSSPDPYIAWRHIVAGSPTIFSFDNRILPDQFLKYMKLEWVTASGNILITERSANTDTQNSNDFARAYFDAEYGGFTFPGEGDYTVRLTMISVNECVATTERVVHILPLVSVSENFTPHSFEAGTDGWWVDNTFLFTPTADKFSKAVRPNDWETGTSGGARLNSASVGQRAMFTKAGGLYKINQTAWVMSPAFDLSALSRPMVSFDRMFLTEARKDGVVFQYSIDNGDTWQVLGSYEALEGQSTGENWYSIDGISSDPGSQDFYSTSSSRVGWAGSSLKTGQVDFTYASARQKLDLIPGDRKQVIFRFAFASNASEDAEDEGFAFDNFWIGNRTKQVLLEKFSSTTNRLSNDVDTQLQTELAVLANNNNDIIPIAYHTEFKGGEGTDPFNQLNKADAGSRVLFYGITDVPTSILSGNVSEETYRAADASGRPFRELELSRSSLRDPLAGISIEQLSAGDTQLSFNVKVSRKVSTNGTVPSSGEHRLYVAIVEDSLEFQGKPYQSVMRKLLPNGNGEIISGFAGLSTETVLTFPYTWEISGKLVKDPDQLKVVAFIQSNDTKLIYQAASLDIKGKQATETGVDLPGEIASSYALYPNPANTEVGVRFDSQLNNDFEWRLIDQAGAIISNGRVQKGSEGVTLDTRSVPSGMYFVIISNENAMFEPKKLLIIH